MSATQSECLSFRRLPVFSVLVLVLAICAPAWLQAAEADGSPSGGAHGMCGAMGTFEFRPPDWIGHKEPPPGPVTWWKDTDGVDPGTAGCHLGLKSDGGETNGRMFGEACLSDTLLVESNPAAGVSHSHKNDIGHPDKFDCQKWCVCQKYTKGACVKVTLDPPCGESAKCACSN
jgi:hypothetical protein